MPITGVKPFEMPLRLIDNIAMGHHLQSVAVSRDGTQLYVGLVDENCISIVDLATGGIAGRIDLPGSPTDVQVSPNGSTALVTALERAVSGERGKAYVIDLRTNELTADFPAGFNPQTAVFSPQGTFAYICDFSDDAALTPGGGTVLALRTVDWLLTATIPTGDHTFSAATSPDGNFVYASTTFAGGSLAIVDTNIQEVVGFVTDLRGAFGDRGESGRHTGLRVGAGQCDRVHRRCGQRSVDRVNRRRHRAACPRNQSRSP